MSNQVTVKWKPKEKKQSSPPLFPSFEEPRWSIKCLHSKLAGESEPYLLHPIRGQQREQRKVRTSCSSVLTLTQPGCSAEGKLQAQGGGLLRRACTAPPASEQRGGGGAGSHGDTVCKRRKRGATFPFPACEHTQPLGGGDRRPVCLDVFLRCLPICPRLQVQTEMCPTFFSLSALSSFFFLRRSTLQPGVLCRAPGSQGSNLSLVVGKQWCRLRLLSSPLLTGSKVSARANPPCAIAFLSDG